MIYRKALVSEMIDSFSDGSPRVKFYNEPLPTQRYTAFETLPDERWIDIALNDGTISRGKISGHEFDESAIKNIDKSNYPYYHYKGALGDFYYDSRDFEFSHDEYGYNLDYIGNETDGSKIHIPDGIMSCRHMFEMTDIETAPVIPESVKDCSYMFADCEHLKVPPSYIPNNVHDISYMFFGCKNLERVPNIPESV